MTAIAEEPWESSDDSSDWEAEDLRSAAEPEPRPQPSEPKPPEKMHKPLISLQNLPRPPKEATLPFHVINFKPEWGEKSFWRRD